MDGIDKDSPCLFNIVVAIVLWATNVVLLPESRASLQRLLNKLHKLCTSSSLGVNLSKTKIMIFDHNKRKLNQEAYYLDKEQIEITHEYKYLGIGFYSHGYFEPSIKRRRIIGMKALMSTLRKEAIVRVTCWNLKSHLFKALVLHTHIYGTKIWRGSWKTLIERFSRKTWRCIWCLTSKCILRLPILFCWSKLEKSP